MKLKRSKEQVKLEAKLRHLLLVRRQRAGEKRMEKPLQASPWLYDLELLVRSLGNIPSGLDTSHWKFIPMTLKPGEADELKSLNCNRFGGLIKNQHKHKFREKKNAEN